MSDSQPHCVCGHWESNHDPLATRRPTWCRANGNEAKGVETRCEVRCQEWVECDCGTALNHRLDAALLEAVVSGEIVGRSTVPIGPDSGGDQ